MLDVDQWVRNLQKKLAAVFAAGRAGRPPVGLGWLLIIAGALWLLSGLYVVQHGERGIVLRFGALHEVMAGGLHWHLPYPLEAVQRVNVEKVSAVPIGYRMGPRGRHKIAKEALMLTQDEDLADVEFTVQYKIRDPAEFLFNVRNLPTDAEALIRQAAEVAALEVIGKSKLDRLLAGEAESVSGATRGLLQQMLDRYRTGIQIVAVDTPSVQLPEDVQAAADEAMKKAREEQQRMKLEAETYAAETVEHAQSKAARMIQEARAYRASVIARAEGEARRFAQVATEYAKAPAVTRERLYLETMEQVLSNTTKIFIDQKNANNTFSLPLDRLAPPKEPAAASAPGAAEAEAATPSRDVAGRVRDSRRRGPP